MYHGRIKFVKLDVDKNTSIADKEGIVITPTIKLYYNGEIGQIRFGAMETDEFDMFLRRAYKESMGKDLA
ncbi:thioredoxin [archaeon]|nr:MAG: thioredoxin [archaeon]